MVFGCCSVFLLDFYVSYIADCLVHQLLNVMDSFFKPVDFILVVELFRVLHVKL